jgi:ABC-type Fe3+-hydroxamate transport system substrate-binding protein
MRIVSCVPSISELIFDLNAESLVGRTKFCVFPDSIFRVPKIGGTKNLDLEKICKINPDLIVSAKEENDKSQIDFISKEFPVKLFDIQTINDSLQMIIEVGELVENLDLANEMVSKIKNIDFSIRGLEHKKVLYLIWQNPWMTIGGDTFIADVIRKMGLINVFDSSRRYPIIPDIEAVRELKPDYIFLSSEPFPFKQKHQLKLETLFPNSKVLLVDGAYFSWYGSRFVYADKYFRSLKF